jgi:hypothetical protein
VDGVTIISKQTEGFRFLICIERAHALPNVDELDVSRRSGSCFGSNLLPLQAHTLRALARAEDVALVRTVRTRFAKAFISNSKVVLGWIQARVVNIKIAEVVAHDGRSLQSLSCRSKEHVRLRGILHDFMGTSSI